MARKKEKGIQIEELEFYFDSVARDRMDSGGLGRKTGQIFGPREKLLSLPVQDFDAVITTVSRLVDGKGEDKDKKVEEEKRRTAQARELFERSTDPARAPTNATQKISPV